MTFSVLWGFAMTNFKRAIWTGRVLGFMGTASLAWVLLVCAAFVFLGHSTRNGIARVLVALVLTALFWGCAAFIGDSVAKKQKAEQ